MRIGGDPRHDYSKQMFFCLRRLLLLLKVLRVVKSLTEPLGLKYGLKVIRR
jgi:hypothetical protein